MTYYDFEPFYERWIKFGSSSFINKFLFSIFLGLFILGLHFLAIDNKLFSNYGWILSLIIIEAITVGLLIFETITFSVSSVF